MTNAGFSVLRKWFAALSAIGAAASLCLTAGCSKSDSGPLRIGINAWPGYEFLYLAQERGLYAAEGVQVKLVEFSSLADARRAYKKGQLDGFATTLVEVIQARAESDQTPEVVLAVDYSEGADMIIAK